MLTTTFARLKEAGACSNGFRKLAKALGGVDRYGRETPITFQQIYESNGYSDTLWALKAATDETERLHVCRGLVLTAFRHVITAKLNEWSLEIIRKSSELLDMGLVYIKGSVYPTDFQHLINRREAGRGDEPVEAYEYNGRYRVNVFNPRDALYVDCGVGYNSREMHQTRFWKLLKRMVKKGCWMNWENLKALFFDVAANFMREEESDCIVRLVICPEAVKRMDQSAVLVNACATGIEEAAMAYLQGSEWDSVDTQAPEVPTEAPCKPFEFRADLTLEQYTNIVYNAAIYDVLALACEGMYVLDPCGLGYPKNGRIVNQVNIEGLIKPV